MDSLPFQKRLASLKRKTRRNTFAHHAYEILVRETYHVHSLDDLQEAVERRGAHWQRCALWDLPGSQVYLHVSATVKRLFSET
ncbi:hypothetical protein KSF_086960 [Reticulibacter mediterranei]|uniref:Uncharacterized protein n=1 Tax=Reticulibacter mediterranei TaxID=2778369 RepID=A0A8J3N7I6_9CHLR|nr:hypothetical protein [Reticulibacter mediterranei]GHO98648.1 hypothetical protein KSF_086960 [Reticulibacter mediterranei]